MRGTTWCIVGHARRAPGPRLRCLFAQRGAPEPAPVEEAPRAFTGRIELQYASATDATRAAAASANNEFAIPFEDAWLAGLQTRTAP